MTVGSVWCASPDAPTGRMPDPDGDLDDVRREAWGHPKVVAHFLDGHLLKGFALDFRLSRGAFLLRRRDAVDVEAAIRIRLAHLKALFFVKDFEGDPTYRELSDAARPSLLGRQVRVRFRDGEVLRGTSPSRDPGGAGFFLVPMDARSNNRRIYVTATNAVECRFEGGDEP